MVSDSERGPFVYRLGRKIFILERGVRLSYGLQLAELIFGDGYGDFFVAEMPMERATSLSETD